MEQFGKYTLLRRIGVGGMAEVFLARTTVAQGLNKQLVIKKIHPAFARSRQFVSMFVDEAKIALSLNHPNIVQVFDFGAVGDTFFLAMEYVEGLDLLRLMQEASRQNREFPLGLCSYIIQQVAKGLDYAHRKTDEFGEPLGIVHRDISQQNILISWDGAVKIVDFGIARARDVHEEAGVIKGKYAYMSPEQARGEMVDRRSDVFSAGVVLFELVCARPLFPGKGKKVLEQVKAGAIARPRYLKPELPRELEQTMLRALTFHRDDRYQTARDLQTALARFQLNHAQISGELIDSATLAQFVAQIIPDEKRKPPPMPPSAGPVQTPSAAGTPVGDSLASGSPETDAGSGRLTPIPRGPGEARERLASHAPGSSPSSGPSAERKYVFVLEGHMCGLGELERKLGHSGGAALVADFFKVARDIAYKHDAHIHRTDEVGFTFVVGLPVAAEDDASRTIRLALALVDALDGIGHDVGPELRLAVGIQRGIAIFKREGGRKFSYELASATTLIARRLAREAQGGEVLVGGRVFRVARTDWKFEELTSIDIPNEPDTQPNITGEEDTDLSTTQRARVYRLRGPKERAERMRERATVVGSLLGRDLELKAMRDAYRDVLVSRRKRQLVIVADAGIGKRALVAEFLEGIAPGEAIVIRAAARVSTAYTPFAIIADLARDLLGLADGASPQEVSKRVERVAALLYASEERSREARGLIQVINMLLGGQRDETADNIDAAERRQRILQALARVEQKFSSDKPLIVIGEDVQWCDDESYYLFRDLLEMPSARPILGLVTSRPESKVLEAAAAANADIIRLEELDEEDRTTLVTRRFVPGENVQELAAQIVARAGGNPFFINEMIDSLVERGIVVPETEDGAHPGLLRWVKRDAPIQVPTSVESLLATRMDRLPQDEKETLMCASVLGLTFSAGAVEGLVGRPPGAELDQLVGRGLLTRSTSRAPGTLESRSPGAGSRAGNYSFRNHMAMTVAYGLLPDTERCELHRTAADRLANSQSYRGGQDDAVIARHLELAGDASAAADRYLKAATHAVDVGGNADAFRQLTRALKLLPRTDHARRFTARRQRLEILGRLTRRPEQQREIENLIKEAEALAEPAKLALAYSRLAQFYIDIGKAPAASRAVAPALDYAREAGDKLGEAEALRLRASIARLVGNNDEALRLCEQALGLCDERRAAGTGADLPEQLASPAPGLDPRRSPGADSERLLQRAIILNNRGTTLWNMGRLQDASESYAEALVIYRMLKLPRLEARILNNMGIIFAALGEFEEALAHYKSALKLDQKLGDRDAIALKLGNIGQTYSDLGDTARGERYLVKALKFAEQTGDRSSTTDIYTSLGQVYLQQGKPDRALPHLEQGLELATEHRDRYQEIRALIYIALAQVEAGRPAEGALELAHSATELAHKMPMLVGEIYGHAVQGLALAKLGKLEQAADSSARAVALLEKDEQTEGAEQILHIHASLSDRAGRHEAAAGAIRAAHAEMTAKASKLQDAELRAIYLSSKVARAIVVDHDRLVGVRDR